MKYKATLVSECPFKIGDDVEVWSGHAKRWFSARVLDIRFYASRNGITPGLEGNASLIVKVSRELANGKSKIEDVSFLPGWKNGIREK